ncbi:MAG: hypothetical protein J6N15_11585 [Ruminiclostridium sp.]|nr:hypothetical protein [Ruminiclostridium sp.]
MDLKDNMMLNSIDAVFYVIVCDDDRCLKKSLVEKIVEHMANVVGATFYATRAGEKISDPKILRDEFKTTIASQIQIITVYTKRDEISLMPTKQRDMFYEAVINDGDFKNTSEIVDMIEKLYPSE